MPPFPIPKNWRDFRLMKHWQPNNKSGHMIKTSNIKQDIPFFGSFFVRSVISVKNQSNCAECEEGNWDDPFYGKASCIPEMRYTSTEARKISSVSVNQLELQPRLRSLSPPLLRTVPACVSDVPGGFTDGAGVVPEDGADDSPVVGFQSLVSERPERLLTELVSVELWQLFRRVGWMCLHGAAAAASIFGSSVSPRAPSRVSHSLSSSVARFM
ncbi:hypothetical protein EYF80_000695 [Liparis tanakae]|uniref:Uncharacterized protein n=1 Tax=Liparis tanakae TaxID=230148 RepID=A0A4Z2JGM6_9TELE|nr:hypothetical protein EYF80_000695 [Liparis tanakae]